MLLKDLSADTTVALQDSFATVHPDAYRDQTQVYNYWTTYPIQRDASYRVFVKKNGGTVTSATTRTPHSPPSLAHNNGFRLPCSPLAWKNDFRIYVEDVDHIAGARVIYPVNTFYSGYDGMAGCYPFFNLYDSIYDVGDDDQYSIAVEYGTHGMCSRKPFDNPYALVVVAAAGPGWSARRGASLNDLAQPDTLTNVRGGVGFVGAVFSDTLRVPIRARTQGP